MPTEARCAKQGSRLPRASLKIGCDAERYLRRFLETVQQSGCVVRCSSIEHKTPNAIVFNKLQKILKLWIIFGCILPSHLLTDHLADLLLKSKSVARVSSAHFSAS